LSVSACRPRVRPAAPPEFPTAGGFFIQVGVFSSEMNASGLARSLKSRAVRAFYFSHASGFFKVWIGSYASRAEASQAAQSLLEEGVIREFFVVDGRTFSAAPAAPSDAANRLRRDLVETARSFIDFPYAWGGASADEGFDCSGLTMAVYRLNGLVMPRSIFAQFEAGRPVDHGDLRPGDLVFFATGGDGRISHVGIFVGNGAFIHAPGTNKSIRSDLLANPYFRGRFCGARRYLGDF
jgi:hypothetical protein